MAKVRPRSTQGLRLDCEHPSHWLTESEIRHLKDLVSRFPDPAAVNAFAEAGGSILIRFAQAAEAEGEPDLHLRWNFPAMAAPSIAIRRRGAAVREWAGHRGARAGFDTWGSEYGTLCEAHRATEAPQQPT